MRHEGWFLIMTMSSTRSVVLALAALTFACGAEPATDDAEESTGALGSYGLKATLEPTRIDRHSGRGCDVDLAYVQATNLSSAARAKVNAALSLDHLRQECTDADLVLTGGWDTSRFPSKKITNVNGFLSFMYAVSWTRKGASTPERTQLIPVNVYLDTGDTVHLGDFLKPEGKPWMIDYCNGHAGGLAPDVCKAVVSPPADKPEMFIFVLDQSSFVMNGGVTLFLDNDAPPNTVTPGGYCISWDLLVREPFYVPNKLRGLSGL